MGVSLESLLEDVVRAVVREELAGFAEKLPTTPTVASPEEWLSARDVAARLGLSQSYLAKLRGEERGPVFHRIGSAVRYRWSDVTDWLEHGQEGVRV